MVSTKLLGKVIDFLDKFIIFSDVPFQVVANYFGNTKKYEPVDKKHIRWAGGLDHPPPDTPTCGFDRSKCPPDGK